MHPVIEALQKRDAGLYETLQRLYDPDSFFECTFLEVTRIAHDNAEFDSSTFDKIDRALMEGCTDDSLYLLFICNVIVVLWNTRQQKTLQRIESLIAIGNSISLENVYSVARVYFLQAKALPMLARNELVRGLALVKEATDLMNPTDPRYIGVFCNYASVLASCGRLADLTQIEREVFDSNEYGRHELFIIKAKLINCVYTGDYEAGFQIREKFHAVIKKHHGHFIELELLKVLSGDFVVEHYESEMLKRFAAVYQKLSQGCIDDAVNAYKYLENLNDHELLPVSNFMDTLLLHLALCAGKAMEARTSFENKKAENRESYLDDFFLVRILLLEKRYVDARVVACRLIQNVEHYGAFHRILFELRFSKEMTLTQFFLLAHDWKELKNLSIAESKPIKPKAYRGAELLIGRSHRMQRVRQQIYKYALLDEIILILGETGTGKELVAKALHQESPRGKEPFLAINCSALTDTLLESELFGYEVGAFTGALRQKRGIFEAAGKGTVFLDEFGDISAKLQASLLRVLESGEIRMLGGGENRKISCRIIVATNKNLEQAIQDKEFRQDLYFRLNRFEIQLPPLREHKEDIGDLIEHFLEEFQRFGGVQKGVTTKVLEIFKDYHWPGNVREFKNAIERLRVLNPNKDIFDVDDLDVVRFQDGFPLPSASTVKQGGVQSKDSVQSLRERHLASASSESEGKILWKSLGVAGRLAYMKNLFLEHQILTRNQIMQVMQTHPITATKDLQVLCQEGFIVRRQPTKSQRSVYFELNSEKNKN